MLIEFTVYESIGLGRGPVGLEPMFLGFEHLHIDYDFSILDDCAISDDDKEKPALL